MLKHLVLIPFLFLIACSNSDSNPPLTLCSQSGAACRPLFVKNSKPGIGKAVVMGDSLAAGYGATSADKTPVGCLSKAFNQATIDHSKAGRTSIEVLMGSQRSFDEQPKLIFISSGGNDTISEISQPGSYPEKQTLDEMAQLFDRALASGALVVYLGLKPPFAGTDRLPAISAMAQLKGVLVVDGMNGFWGDPNLMSDDIHPNDKGYEILCQRTLEALKNYYP